MIDIKFLNLRLRDLFDFFEQALDFLIDSWCSISKSVNHISDHGFKCPPGSVISTDTSENVAKFRFALVSYCKFLSRHA